MIDIYTTQRRRWIRHEAVRAQIRDWSMIAAILVAGIVILSASYAAPVSQ